MGTRVAASWPGGTFSRTVGRAYIPRKSHGFDISCPAAQAGRLAEATKKPSWKPDSSSPCGLVDTYQIIEIGLITRRSEVQILPPPQSRDGAAERARLRRAFVVDRRHPIVPSLRGRRHHLGAVMPYVTGETYLVDGHDHPRFEILPPTVSQVVVALGQATPSRNSVSRTRGTSAATGWLSRVADARSGVRRCPVS